MFSPCVRVFKTCFFLIKCRSFRRIPSELPFFFPVFSFEIPKIITCSSRVCVYFSALFFPTKYRSFRRIPSELAFLFFCFLLQNSARNHMFLPCVRVLKNGVFSGKISYCSTHTFLKKVFRTNSKTRYCHR